MKEKGLTGFQLKIIGLILMVFDHVHEFFDYSGNIPIAFKWVGRIVAPIFIFMAVEGYTHTKSKKKYMLRLYLASLIMSIGNFVIPNYFSRPDNMALMNNIFATLFMITVYLSILDFIIKAIKERKGLKVLLGIFLFIAPAALGILLILGLSSGNMFLVYAALIIPTPIFVEGGPILILFGIALYLLRQNKKGLIIVFSIMSLSLMFTGELSISGLFMKNYQWMMIFAAPFLYFYNGKKGIGMKYLFYIFYPAHIYLFYIISCVVMNK